MQLAAIKTWREPRSCLNRDVELDSRGASWVVFCFKLFSTVVSVDTVSVTLFLTTVERASRKVPGYYMTCFALASPPTHPPTTTTTTTTLLLLLLFWW